jgi:hypothetical protein
MTWRLDFDWPALPIPANHRFDRFTLARKVSAVRDEVFWRCTQKNLPLHLERIHLELHYIPKVTRRRDPDGAAPTLKAIVDGLARGKGVKQGYGLIDDDTFGHVTAQYVVDAKNSGVVRSRFYLLITDLSDEVA